MDFKKITVLRTGGGTIALIAHLALAVLGLIMLFMPARAMAAMVAIIAIILGVSSVALLVSGLIKNPLGVVRIVFGGIGIVAAILLLIFRVALTQTALPLVIGIWVIISALISVSTAFVHKHNDQENWWLPLLSAFICLLLGLLILANLSSASMLLGVVIGLYLVLDNVMSISEWMVLRKVQNDSFTFF